MKRSPDSATAPALANFALQFLSGKEVGRELPLVTSEELIIGRGKSAHIVISDEKISRKHSRIFFAGVQLMIEDLGSSNGTFVNGVKIDRVALNANDRIRISTYSFKINATLGVTPAAQSWWDEAQANQGTARSTDKDALMSGSLKSISLVELLQLLSNSQKSGVLAITTKQDHGKIHLRDGQICHGSINGRTAIQPEKTIYRMLRWKTGKFEWSAPVEEVFDREISEPTAALLLDGAQEMDKLAELEAKLPANAARLQLTKPMPEPLSDLKRAELDILQLVLEREVVLDVLDQFKGPDLDAYQLLLDLLSRKIAYLAGE